MVAPVYAVTVEGLAKWLRAFFQAPLLISETCDAGPYLPFTTAVCDANASCLIHLVYSPQLINVIDLS